MLLNLTSENRSRRRAKWFRRQIVLEVRTLHAAAIEKNHPHLPDEAIAEVLCIGVKKLNELRDNEIWQEAVNFWHGRPLKEPMPMPIMDKPSKRRRKQLKAKKEMLYGFQHGCCNGCKESFTFQDITIDHILPISLGGTHDFENLQLLCKPCNIKKGSKTQAELIDRLVAEGILKAKWHNRLMWFAREVSVLLAVLFFI